MNSPPFCPLLDFLPSLLSDLLSAASVLLTTKLCQFSDPMMYTFPTTQDGHIDNYVTVRMIFRDDIAVTIVVVFYKLRLDRVAPYFTPYKCFTLCTPLRSLHRYAIVRYHARNMIVIIRG